MQGQPLRLVLQSQLQRDDGITRTAEPDFSVCAAEIGGDDKLAVQLQVAIPPGTLDFGDGQVQFQIQRRHVLRTVQPRTLFLRFYSRIRVLEVPGVGNTRGLKGGSDPCAANILRPDVTRKQGLQLAQVGLLQIELPSQVEAHLMPRLDRDLGF